MNRNNRVIIKSEHKYAGKTGTIIETSKGMANVFWDDEDVFWIDFKDIMILE